jgi:hypothetical protein
MAFDNTIDIMSTHNALNAGYYFFAIEPLGVSIVIDDQGAAVVVRLF